MTSKRRSLINLLSLSYLSKSISKSLLIMIEYSKVNVETCAVHSPWKSHNRS